MTEKKRVGHPPGINHDRINISLPKGLHLCIKSYCKRNKMTKSGFLQVAAAHFIENFENGTATNCVDNGKA